MAAEFVHSKRSSADSTPVLAIGTDQLYWAENDKLMEFPDPPSEGFEEFRRNTKYDPQRIHAFELAWQFQPIEYWKEALSKRSDKRSTQKLQHRPGQSNREIMASPLSGNSSDGSGGSAELSPPEDASSSSSRQPPTPPKSTSDLAACQPGPSTPKTTWAGGHGKIHIMKEDDDELIFFRATSKANIPTLPSLASTTFNRHKDLYDLALESEITLSHSMSNVQTSSPSGQHNDGNSQCATASATELCKQEKLMINVLVSCDEDEKIFSLPPHRMTVDLCEQINWDVPDGIHMRLNDTDPKRFGKVEAYLTNGDWSPRLIDPKGSFPRLEPQPYSMKIRQEWMEECAFVWVTAAKLGLGCLRRLVLEKVKLLAPYSHLGILILARATFETYPDDENHVDRVDMEMRELLADSIAHNYNAMESGSTAGWLQELLMKDIGLSVAVAERRDRLRELDYSSDEDTTSDGDADEDERNEDCTESGIGHERKRSNGHTDDAETNFEDCMDMETDDEEEFEDQMELVEGVGDPKFGDE
ncbi:MAG: hypothetical protein Q9165_001249 [Trypethelium subeluteriae]